MRSAGIKEEDLKESFVRASGAGGQKLNKTSSAVKLIHLPTGTKVHCRESRSQALNRFHARRQLLVKINGKENPAALKIRRNKKKRKSRAEKKYHSGA